jgi:hypothetical protein
MTLRHAFALGLVGWYLMVPPLIPFGAAHPKLPLVRENATINEWSIRTSFDSAKECEIVRKCLQTNASRNLDPNKPLNENFGSRLLRSRWLQDSMSLCVASDDLRLKGD